MKKLMWAGVFVVIGAAIVHPLVSTAQAAATTGTTQPSQSLGQAGTQSDDGQRQFAFLSQALAATNASPNGYAIHDWTILNNQFMNHTQLASLGEQLEKEFALTNAKLTTRSEQNETYYQVDGQWPNSTNVRIVLTSLPGTTTQSPSTDEAAQTVLTVTALGTGSAADNFARQYDGVEHMVAAVQGTPQMSAYLTGSLASEVPQQQANHLATMALQAVNASSVESLKTQWETSVSGYAADALTYIYTNGRRMNVQVAVHDDTFHHSTDVLVGTPIITTTY
ncbi:YwmB family TATA-box binding protein [Alicyclobacillus dauci]|uniref:YwmB family TATA-box binding protein n=1 Tax=Alicyclobacillus dauci TaxID=1475485 RepID=A0ABY6Z1Z3_9BACL|nr:YwmB family TATA-box binding protein [Alicyclobacillus dauci]WAH36857.1 YwmB family TATA-box binding protein [Alicyclobacillus dauci]